MPHSFESLDKWVAELAACVKDNPFSDIKNHWGKNYILASYFLNLIQGYPGGKVGPDNHPTRAEIITMLVRSHLISDDSFEPIIHDAESAVVTVMRKGGQQGSGTHIGLGYVLTNAHCVLDQNNQLSSSPYQIYWLSGGYGEDQQAKYAEGPCIWVKATSDLAIIKVGLGPEDLASLPKLVLGDPKKVTRGQPVVVIGTPQYLWGTVTQGIVSFVGRNRSYEIAPRVYARIPDMIQIDAAVNPGNSGGALVNRRCQLIGVPSAKLVHTSIEGIAFCIGLESVLSGLKEAYELGIIQKSMSAVAPKIQSMTSLDAELMDEVKNCEPSYVEKIEEVIKIFEAQGVKSENE